MMLNTCIEENIVIIEIIIINIVTNISKKSVDDLPSMAFANILAHLNTVGGDTEGDHLLSLPGMARYSSSP